MKTNCDFVRNLKNANSKMSRNARFQGSHIFLQTETTSYLRRYLLLKIRLVFSSFLYFEKVWIFFAFRFNFLLFGCYFEYTVFWRNCGPNTYSILNECATARLIKLYEIHLDTALKLRCWGSKMMSCEQLITEAVLCCYYWISRQHSTRSITAFCFQGSLIVLV